MIVSRAIGGNAFCSRFNDETMRVEITAVHGFDSNPVMPSPLELDAYDLGNFIETLKRLEKAINEALEADVTSTLAAQGIKYVTPPSPKPSMEEEIEEISGQRCPDYEPGCPCCDMWHAYDVGAYSCVRADLDEVIADLADDPVEFVEAVAPDMELKRAIADIMGSIQPKRFAYTPETCPSKHWNGGDDICADCGTDLQE